MADGENYVQPIQHITFYNVIGLIEKEKNIYYVPFVQKLLEEGKTTVCESYKSLFDKVCPPPNSDYVNMSISQWNPEDRVLRVKGSVDTFRKGSGVRSSTHKVLNYCVLERQMGDVYDKHFFYGFFIENAKQVGANTVELTLIPDSFTNVFYWCNTKVLTSDFNPFNSLVANPFVERQHYNRFIVESTEYIDDEDYGVEEPALHTQYFLSKAGIQSEEGQRNDICSVKTGRTAQGALPELYMDLIVLKKIGSHGETISTENVCRVSLEFDTSEIFIFKSTNPTSEHILEQLSFTDYYNADWHYVLEIKTSAPTSYVYYETDDQLNVNDFYGVMKHHSQIVNFDNMDLFIKTEEEYKYRQLFKDLRVPLDFKKPTSTQDNVVNLEDEFWSHITSNIHSVEDVDSLIQELHSSGKDDVIKKLFSRCIAYLHIITNEQVSYPTVIEAPTDTPNVPQYFLAHYNKDYDIKQSFTSMSQHIVIPFINRVKGMEYFADYLNGKLPRLVQSLTPFIHGIYVVGKYKNVDVLLRYYDEVDFGQFVSEINDKYGYYIQSMFITPYCELDFEVEYSVLADVSYVVFTGQLVNEDTPPTTAFRWKTRRGSWFLGYRYNTHYAVPLELSGYDNAIVDKPTISMLPFVKPELNSNQTAFLNRPDISFVVDDYANPTSISLKTYEEGGETLNYIDKNILCFGFLIGNKGFENQKSDGTPTKNILEIPYGTHISSESGDINPKEEFYEPVLEMEPYNFYSVSFSEVESVLDRRRYYQMVKLDSTTYYSQYGFKNVYQVPLFYNQSVNTMLKFGVIPEYKINGVSARYYSEALLFVTTSGASVKVESYSAFMYVMTPILRTQSHLAKYNAEQDMKKAWVSAITGIAAGAMAGAAGGGAGAAAGAAGAAIKGLGDIINQQITNEQNIYNVQETQKAQKSSAGAKADTFQQAGSDYIYEVNLEEYSVMLNHYRIDNLSYRSVAKMLERYGYYVHLYESELNCFNRIGYNFIKLTAFDFNESEISVTEEQMMSLDNIFKQGVTLLHEKDFLDSSRHNYETVLELIED